MLDVYGFDSTLNGYAPAAASTRPTTSSCCAASPTIPGEAAPTDPAFVALLHGDARPGRRRPTRTATRSIRPQRSRSSASTTTPRSTAASRSTAWAATTSSRSTTTARSRRSTAARATTRFQIGQLYGSKRDATRRRPATPGNTSGGSLHDAATSSAPSRRRAAGCSAGSERSRWSPQGGAGDDIFTVYSNQAPLRLEGDDDNDLFVVRAFALAETTGQLHDRQRQRPDLPDRLARRRRPGRDAAARRAGFSTAAETDIRTGAGNNQVQYNINAPVSIDGGNGFDKVVVLGTEFADHIVVTAKAIYGAGLAVTLRERRGARDRRARGRRHVRRPLDRARRRDARHRRPRQRRDQRRRRRGRRRRLARHRGHERHVNHDVALDRPALRRPRSPTASTSPSRAPTQGQVIIEETGGFTDVPRGRPRRADTLPRLPRARRRRRNVYVTVSAARSPQTEQPRRRHGPGLATCRRRRGLRPRHRTSTASARRTCRSARSCSSSRRPRGELGRRAQTVSRDRRRRRRCAEGDRVVVVSHSVISDDPDFDHAVVRNVEVTVHDDDLPAIQVVAASTRDRQPGQHDASSSRARRPPQLDRHLRRQARDRADRAGHRPAHAERRPRRALGGGRASRPSRRAPRASRASTTSSSRRRLADRRPRHRHGRRRLRPPGPAQHDDRTRPSTGATADAYDDALPRPRLDALVVDDDTAGVVVHRERRHARSSSPATTTGGPGPGDSYGIRLTRSRRRTVTVALITDGQTDVVAGGRDRLRGDRRRARAAASSPATSPIAGTVVTRTGDVGARQLLRRGLRARPADPDRERGRGERRLHDRRRVALDGQSLTLDDRARRRHLHAARSSAGSSRAASSPAPSPTTRRPAR